MKLLIKALADNFNAEGTDYRDIANENVKSTKRKLLTISESLKHPTYEGTPFFIKSKISHHNSSSF